METLECSLSHHDVYVQILELLKDVFLVPIFLYFEMLHPTQTISQNENTARTFTYGQVYHHISCKLQYLSFPHLLFPGWFYTTTKKRFITYKKDLIKVVHLYQISAFERYTLALLGPNYCEVFATF